MTTPVPFQIPFEVSSALQPGERIVWMGRPGKPTLKTSPDLRGLLFTTIVAVIFGPGIFVTIALASRTPSLAALGLFFGLLLLLAGLPSVLRLQKMRRLTYVLTDTRALVAGDGAVSAEARGLGPSFIQVDPQGSRMTVVFGNSVVQSTALYPVGNSRVPITTTSPRVAFVNVDDVAGLQAALHATDPTWR